MGPRILLFAFAAGLACAQGNHAFPEHVGNIGLNRAPVVWTSPESIVRDLQSNDEAALAKAQRLLGLDESYFRDAPNEAGLQYFFLGASRGPIVIVRAAHYSFEYAAVAVPSKGTWKRIAVFSCWCKYENEPAFMSIGYSPQGAGPAPAPMVTVRAVGGGSGDYEQTEAWFGLIDDRLVEIISFASRKTSCHPESPCYNLRRWFDGRQMIEGRNDDLRNTQPAMNADLAVRDFKSITCTPYKWNAANFRYVPSGPAAPCRATPPK